MPVPQESPLRYSVLSTRKKPVKIGKDDEHIINIELPRCSGVQLSKLLKFDSNYGHAGPCFVNFLLNEVRIDELVAQLERVNTNFFQERLELGQSLHHSFFLS